MNDRWLGFRMIATYYASPLEQRQLVMRQRARYGPVFSRMMRQPNELSFKYMPADTQGIYAASGIAGTILELSDEAFAAMPDGPAYNT